MNKKNKVLIIAAHPDDELLGCGGTARLHVLNGDTVHSVIICEGQSHRNINQGEGAHMKEAAKHIGGTVESLNFPDQRLDTLCLVDIITPLEKIVAKFQPNIVYCQYGFDINRDHELLFKAALVATRPVDNTIEAIYSFDTASSTEWAYPRSFQADTWVDISSTLNAKLAAMSCYKTELRPYPHPRSLKSLQNKANAWGNQVCLEAAEVFMTIRRKYESGKTPL